MVTPKFVATVNGYEKVAKPVIAPHETTPAAFVLSAFEPLQFDAEEIVRLVVDAVPKYPVPLTVKAVVLANGKVEAVDDVAVKYDATTWPTTESFAYGDVVPIPTRLLDKSNDIKYAESDESLFALKKDAVPFCTLIPKLLSFT